MQALVRPGDLVFTKVTPQSTFGAKIIAIASILRKEGTRATQYSHVAIVDWDVNYVIEARWPKLRRTQIDWSDSNLEIYRIQNFSVNKATAFMNHANSCIGQWYDLGQFLFGLFNFKKAEICTSLVINSAKVAGISLGQAAGRLVTPNELAEDPQLKRINIL